MNNGEINGQKGVVGEVKGTPLFAITDEIYLALRCARYTLGKVWDKEGNKTYFIGVGTSLEKEITYKETHEMLNEMINKYENESEDK